MNEIDDLKSEIADLRRELSELKEAYTKTTTSTFKHVEAIYQTFYRWKAALEGKK